MNYEEYYQSLIQVFSKINENPITSGVLGNFLTYLVGFLFLLAIGTVTHARKKKREVIHQTFIMIDQFTFFCRNECYKVADIPTLMRNYRGKFIHSHLCKLEQEEHLLKEEVYIDKTRISTFVMFTDGSRVALIDRRNSDVKQAVENPLLDCHGAIPFNNTSLHTKVSNEFMDSSIIKMIAIPGVAIEKNQKKLFKLLIPGSFETCIMIGFIVFVSEVDLEKTNDDKKIKNNQLFKLSCISPEEKNLSSKVSLALKFLKAHEKQ